MKFCFVRNDRLNGRINAGANGEAGDANPVSAAAQDAPAHALDRFAEGLRAMMERHGHQWQDEPNEETQLVFNFIDPQKPRAFRRRSQATFVCAVAQIDRDTDISALVQGGWKPGAGGAGPSILKQAYPLLIRAVSNLLLYRVPHDNKVLQDRQYDTHVVTLEQGSFPVPPELEDGSQAYFDYLYRRIEPLATSRLVVDNLFLPDLEPELWNGDEHTEQIYQAGLRLAEMDLLPAPFPIQELLPPEDFRHVQHLYNIGGLSYGNVSVRHDQRRFWMSASGVDKSHLRKVGEEILMVKDFDREHNRMVLSVPANVERPRRVSVDAIEHWMIYREHPGVGAILHIHAWIPGIEATEFNYPCGTSQLAMAVAEKVRQSPDPNRAIVGLKNHGMTITGPSLDEIFARIDGKVERQVPMS